MIQSASNEILRTSPKIKIETKECSGGSDSSLSDKSSLPSDFKPGDNDVVIGRGKKCYNHVGNKALQQIVASKLHEYSNSKDKTGKSSIISLIVAQIREKGAFAKENPNTGEWFDVGDQSAREKVAQTFRDALHEKYKSSTAFKTKKRRLEKSAKIGATFMKAACSKRARIDRNTLPFELHGIMHHPFLDRRDDRLLPQQNRIFAGFQSQFQPHFGGVVVDGLSKLFSSFPSHVMEDENPFEPIPISTAVEMEHYRCGSVPTTPIAKRDGIEKESEAIDDSDYYIMADMFESDQPDKGLAQCFDSFPTSNIQGAKTA